MKAETTSDLTPDEIHALGLAELSRIEPQMEQAKRDAGFNGSLEAFRHYLQTDPKLWEQANQVRARFGQKPLRND